MTVLAEKISRLDFISILNSYGIEVKKQRSGRYVGICPLHSDTSPSFYVFTDGSRDRFKCFGCGAHGDILDFVMQYHQCDTKEGLRRLEIEIITKPEQRHYQIKKQHGVKQFEHWRRLIIAALIELISIAEASTLEQIIEYPRVIDAAQKWRYWRDILTDGADKEQIEFYFRYREKLSPLFKAMEKREKIPKTWVCLTVGNIKAGGFVHG